MATGGRFGGLQPAGFFVLRTPLLAAAEFEGWGALGDRGALRARLGEVFRRPEVRDALFLASPSLIESLPHWEKEPNGERGQRVEHSLVRYFARMSRRPTPFGLFAGTSLGRIGERTHFGLRARADYRRHTSISFTVLERMTDVLLAAPQVREQLRYHPNSSLAWIKDGLTYQRPIAVEGNRDKGFIYNRLSIEPDEALLAILSAAERGATLPQLRKAVRRAARGASPAEIDALLHACIDNAVLEADFGPPLTGDDPTRALAAQLSRLKAGDTPPVVARVADQLAEIDRGGLGADLARYRALADTLGQATKVELPHLLHAELVKPGADLTLSATMADDLLHGLELLARFSPRLPPPRDLLERFERRFGEREVPLLEALSGEYGIGEYYGGDTIPSPVLERLPPPAGKASPGTPPEARDGYLVRRALECLRSGKKVLELGPADIPPLGGDPQAPLSWPSALAVFATFAGPAEPTVDGRHHQIYFSGCRGPSGAELLGRFCTADPALRGEVEGLLRREEALRPEVAFAELVHLQPGIIEGGILARPVLRRYEIPYLGKSGIAREQRIPPRDLLVSLRHGRFVLRSRSRGVVVVPRMSNAHAINEGQTALYQFLNALIRQDDAPLVWRWGAAEALPQLPRVASGRFVFALARWRLDAKRLEPLGKAAPAGKGQLVERWRSELGLPRFVTLADGDNKLPIDLENPLSVEAFASLVGSRSSIELEEMFPPADQLCASGPEGAFAHEVVVPFVRGPAAPAVKARQAARVAAPKPRDTNYLYLKLYAGPATCDRLLREVVPPLLAKATAARELQRWFFIRYADPDPHLRLRFFGPARVLERRTFDLRRRLEREEIAWRVQLDTYQPETFRYGGPDSLELAERLFQIDSEAVLALLALPEVEAEPMARWAYGLLSADRWLEGFGLDLAARREVVERGTAHWAKALGAGADHQHRRGEQYRERRAVVERLLKGEAVFPEAAAVLALLGRRQKRAAPLLRRFKALARAGRLSTPLPDIATSVVHMAMNRTFADRANEEELVIYDFLGRSYESALARTKSGPPKQ